MSSTYSGRGLPLQSSVYGDDDRPIASSCNADLDRYVKWLVANTDADTLSSSRSPCEQCFSLASGIREVVSTLGFCAQAYHVISEYIVAYYDIDVEDVPRTLSFPCVPNIRRLADAQHERMLKWQTSYESALVRKRTTVSELDDESQMEVARICDARPRTLAVNVNVTGRKISTLGISTKQVVDLSPLQYGYSVPPDVLSESELIAYRRERDMIYGRMTCKDYPCECCLRLECGNPVP